MCLGKSSCSHTGHRWGKKDTSGHECCDSKSDECKDGKCEDGSDKQCKCGGNGACQCPPKSGQHSMPDQH